jgi:hypothetical protein
LSRPALPPTAESPRFLAHRQLHDGRAGSFR